LAVKEKLFTEQRLRYIGWAITALALALIGWSISTSDFLETDAWRDPAVLVGISASAAIFTLCLCLIFAAWYLVIMSISHVHISWREGFCIYAISQIYKYVPSNVVHHIGRYYMLRQRGVDHRAATWGFLTEVVLILVASTLVALLFGAPLVRSAMADLGSSSLLYLIIGALALVVGAGIAALLLGPRETLQSFLSPFFRAQVLQASIAALLLHIAARVVGGAALWWLAGPVLGSGELSLGGAIAVWAAAWTLGYITPGATAGFGIREAIMMAALVALKIPVAEATLLALGFRVATTLGDLLFAAMGWLMQRFVPVPVKPSHHSES
jgi:glycosyltransferase 2 family protein